MSCNDLCVTSGYDASNEFYRETRPRATKNFRCGECGDLIAPGDVYHYASGKSDGDFFTARSCAACDEIRTAFCCDTWMFTALWEDIRDQLFPEWNEIVAIDCLAKLTSDAAIAKMRAKYAEWCENTDRDLPRWSSSQVSA